MAKSFALLALVAVAAASGAVEITDANYAQHIGGTKNAFVKFLAPWCGHCKSMKPAWDQLGDKFADSPSVVIGDADCTVQKAVCDKFGVKGYPTIKYYLDGDTTGLDYSGGRDYESLEKFSKDTLEVMCMLETPAQCDEKEQKYITKMTTKGGAAKELARLQGMQGNSMKAELKLWLNKRINILTQMAAKEEL